MWEHYYQPATLDEALPLLRDHAGAARIVAGGTDVMVELSRGVRPTSALIDISQLRELAYIREDAGLLRIGALATHNDVIASAACVARALPLAQACWELGAPQIRTRATVAGNLVTASPANDTISPLMALGAELVLASAAGERTVPLHAFYTGFRRTALRPDELLREIRVPTLGERSRGLYLKLGLRRAQAISVIHLAFALEFEEDMRHIRTARIALGCLAPTVVLASAASAYLAGRELDEATCAEAARLCAQGAQPIGDVRGSADYRLLALRNMAADGLRQLAEGRERELWPAQPVLLESDRAATAATPRAGGIVEAVRTTINGQPHTLVGAQAKTLLDALRDDAGLTGTKSGCAEGECGACTVWLDGKAVMSCLTPAAQANGAHVTTIEGLGSPDELHPLQSAFIRNAAVQCGYCIPGMLMAGAKLLDEQPCPNRQQAQCALSGNICRCTGYRKILDAVMDAAHEQA
ncbi:2Fe-2S iron-sulfur cluster binding domain-containing protein [Chloroflexia bacterium SDU3-3]|nr:2Fe-2S iron-sulfur cluster binding domain-containing protein [Chloroflexia bacterium SDU3-3]